MKRFFYLCAALLCLSLAFHFGYTTARAQAPGNPVVTASPDAQVVVTANGDIYRALDTGGPSQFHLVSNVFSGATPALHESWGSLKARYAPQSAPVLQTPTNK